MAHALWGYEGPCRNIHGHSYKLSVTVSGKINKGSSSSGEAMVMDFSDLKKIVNENIIATYDHALVLDKGIPEELKKAAGVSSNKIVYLNGMPTCEFLTVVFAEILIKKLPSNILLHHLKLHETATSFAEWYAEENRA